MPITAPALAHPPPVQAAAPHLMDVSMFWDPDGSVRHLLSTKHTRMLAMGWRHSVLAPGAHGPDHFDAGGLRLPAPGGLRLTLRRGAAQRLIETAQPDIVEAADPYTLGWAVLGATARLGVPAVAFCHSDLPTLAARLVGGADGRTTPRGRWAARRARSYLVGLYSGFDLVMAPSLGMTQRLQQWGIRQAVHQPLGVDCGVFSPQAADPAWRDRLCRQLGLAPATRLLVYTGRFTAENNLQLLADAVRLLGPGHLLLTVGSGPRPPQGPQVHVLPPERTPAALARIVASADVYVHAGDEEICGPGVLEAMACGTLVVVSAGGALGELAHEVGLRVQRQRVREWADAMGASLDSAAGVSSVRALQKARAHDWPVIIEQLSRRYLRLCGPNLRHQRQPAAPQAAPASSAG